MNVHIYMKLCKLEGETFCCGEVELRLESNLEFDGTSKSVADQYMMI